MIGLGTIINTGAIVLAGLTGNLFGKAFDEEKQQALSKACGVCVLFLGVAGALEGMLSVSGGSLVSGRSMFVVLSIAVGTAIGELINVERAFARFGSWLKEKSGNAGDTSFVDAFVTASLTVCIGAMAIVGALQDGVSGDCSMLAAKAVLDFVVIAVMCSSLGKGAAFSAVPVFLFEGGITVLARLIAPILTDGAVANISLIGSILVFCVGVNLVWGKQIRAANMLPAILVAVLLAYLPFGL
jgi:hypothetical protein